MTFQEASRYCKEQLLSYIDTSEVHEIFKRVIEHLTAKSYIDCITDKNIVIDKNTFASIIAQLQTHEPIQYILEHEWFMGKKFIVNKHVLIPRPETQELVQWVLDTIQNNELHILDIGTGSGIIPISIKSQKPNCTIVATDISKDALSVAQKNASMHNVEIQFMNDDILHTTLSKDEVFDIIISNPPYISVTEKNTMHANVLEFEPQVALFVTNNDVQQFYKTILEVAQHNLAKNGKLFLELHQTYAQETEALYKKNHFHTQLKKDMYGNDRMLLAWKEA